MMMSDMSGIVAHQRYEFRIDIDAIFRCVRRTLNTFIEIWRHASTAAHIEARKVRELIPLFPAFFSNMISNYCDWKAINEK